MMYRGTNKQLVNALNYMATERRGTIADKSVTKEAAFRLSVASEIIADLIKDDKSRFGDNTIYYRLLDFAEWLKETDDA
jgi:hypothetical protein